MNLTSKRLLQFFAGCVGACAFTAAAGTQYLVDTFDESSVIYYTAGGPTVAASNRMDIAHYKSTLNSGDLTFFTNSWFAATGDASALTNVTPNILDLNKKPLAGGTLGTYVLNLETEGQTLSRQLNEAVSFLASDVYVDTLIRFTPSEDAPSIGADVKAAVFVNVNSNLVIHAGTVNGFNGGDGNPTNVEIVLAQPINPNQWYRLTIKLGPVSSYSGFQVFLDGSNLISSVGFTSEGSTPGPWFFNASNDSSLNAVAFQGTGMIDELVVADTANGITTPTGVILTLSFGDKITVYDNTAAAAVLTGETVTSGDSITISSVDWFEITGCSGTGVTYSDASRLAVGNLTQDSTGTLTGTEATTVTITAAQLSTPISTGMTGPYAFVDGAKLSQWAIDNHKTQVEVVTAGESWLDDYLMNVAPDTNAKLLISSIEVGATEAIIVVTSDKTDVLTSFAGINGTLKYYTTSNLATGFTGSGTAVSVVGAGTSVTVHIPIASGQFIKAVIE